MLETINSVKKRKKKGFYYSLHIDTNIIGNAFSMTIYYVFELFPVMRNNPLLSIQDRYLFCSGAYDGKVNLYSARKYEFIQSYSVNTHCISII